MSRRRKPPKWEQEPTAPLDPTAPAPGTTYAFRGIFCRDTEFDACYAEMDVMHLNAMECFISAGTTNLLTRMNQLTGTDVGWSLLGHFNESTTGGAFTISDANCTTIVNGIAGHARNSHRYNICDEPDGVGTYLPAQQDLNRAALNARALRIKASDPAAIVSVADFRAWNLDPVTTGRPAGMWGPAADYPDGVVDEVWLSGYPWPTADIDTATIPDQAGWCDAAGIPYLGIVSCHDFGAGHVTPAYPTQAQFTEAMRQWKATNARGIVVYIWYDAEGSTHLRDDASMRTHIGTEMTAVTP